MMVLYWQFELGEMMVMVQPPDTSGYINTIAVLIFGLSSVVILMVKQRVISQGAPSRFLPMGLLLLLEQRAMMVQEQTLDT